MHVCEQVSKIRFAVDELRMVSPLKKRARVIVFRVEVHRVCAADLLEKLLDAGIFLGPQDQMEMIRHQRVREDVDEGFVAMLVLEDLREAVAFEPLRRIFRDNVAHHDVIVRVVEIEQEQKTFVIFLRIEYRKLVSTVIVDVVIFARHKHLTPNTHGEIILAECSSDTGIWGKIQSSELGNFCG